MFLKQEHIDQWLNTQSLEKNKAYELLDKKEDVFYQNQPAKRI